MYCMEVPCNNTEVTPYSRTHWNVHGMIGDCEIKITILVKHTSSFCENPRHHDAKSKDVPHLCYSPKFAASSERLKLIRMEMNRGQWPFRALVESHDEFAKTHGKVYGGSNEMIRIQRTCFCQWLQREKVERQKEKRGHSTAASRMLITWHYFLAS